MQEDFREEVDQLFKELNNLKDEIKKKKEKYVDNSLQNYVKNKDLDITIGDKLKTRRTLKGHWGKVYALDWSSDPVLLVSASQDGKL